jgi:hypothetical protein
MQLENSCAAYLEGSIAIMQIVDVVDFFRLSLPFLQLLPEF